MNDEPPSRTVTFDTTVLAEGWHDSLPDAETLAEAAARAALAAVPPEVLHSGDVEVSLVLSDDAAVQALNRDYRGYDKPTNVLSFAATEDDMPVAPGEPVMLGDVVLALETVLSEARDQDKRPADHLTHLTVHGVLHLLGFDHQDEGEAVDMEALEVRILAGLGVGDPYGVQAALAKADAESGGGAA